MAREKIGDDMMQVRFPDGTFASIDAVSSNRSEFIRYAVAQALKSGSGQRPSKPRADGGSRSGKKFDGQAVKDGLRPDAAVLLSALREKRMTSRDAEKSMGWLGLRYPNAEKQLIQAGLVSIDGGVLVAEGDS